MLIISILDKHLSFLGNFYFDIFIVKKVFLQKKVF